MHAAFHPSMILFTALALTVGSPDAAVGQDAPGANRDEGELIQIGPDRGADGRRQQRGRLRQPGFREVAPAVVSRYWIGVAGGATPPEVRAHVDLDDGLGVMLRSVEPDSPAAEGGLRQYDIVTRVNGDPLADMRQLAEAVGEAGENKARLALELIREGRPTTVWVAPAERPVAPAGGANPWFGGFRGADPFAMGRLPAETSISVTQSGDGPAKIVVRRGDETWELDADDPEAIAALPDDVRPFVERAVRGQPGGQPFGAMLDGRELGERFGLDLGDRLPDFAPGDLQQRLQEMEEQVEALRQRFGAAEDPPAAPEGVPQDVEIPAEN